MLVVTEHKYMNRAFQRIYTHEVKQRGKK
jgi:hypothetical protein